jgi:hypothetical protein
MRVSSSCQDLVENNFYSSEWLPEVINCGTRLQIEMNDLHYLSFIF